MQRPKQQALMFLLGAVLVGGVLGFSAERVLGHGGEHRGQVGREAMYDDLDLSAPQRAQIDSVLDVRQAQIQALLKPIQPQLDSIKSNSRAQFQRILTPAQWQKFLARMQEDSLRRKADADRREQARKTKEQTTP